MRSTLVLLLFLGSFLGYSQIERYKVYNISNEDGLISNNAECLFQDSYGFLWMGSFDGLVRWDGHSFRKYTHDEKDPTSISQNIVYCIYEDKQRRLWIGSIGGLDLYNRETDSFEKIVTRPDLDRIPTNAIVEDKKGNIWLATSSGIGCIEPSSKKVLKWMKAFNHADSLSDNIIFDLKIDRENSLWLASFNKGLIRYSIDTKKIDNFTHIENSTTSICSNKLKKVVVDHEGNIWAGSFDKGVSKLIKNSRTFQNFSSSNTKDGTENHVSCLYEDKHHTIWLGKANELLRYLSKDGKTFIPFTNPAYKKYYLQCTSIASMCEDSFGNTWFGSFCNGLFYTNESKNKFQHYYNNYLTKLELSHETVTCFYEQNKDALWIGTENGLNLFNPTTKSFRHFTKKDGLTSNTIQAITGDKFGMLWIATWSGGLLQMNPRTFQIQSFVHTPTQANSLIYNNIKSLAIQDSILWIGTHGEGLCSYHLTTKKFTHHKNNKDLPFDMQIPAWINHLFLDSKNNLWIGAYGGLYKYDQRTMQAFLPSEKATSISNPDINMICEDAQGTVWVATESGYLNRYNPKTNGFIVYKDGIPRTIKAIQTDASGNLWMSGNDGLYAMDIASKKVVHYSELDGLQGNTFFLKSILKSSNNELYIGGTNGFNVFDPSTLNPPVHPELFYFTDLYVFNQLQKPGSSEAPIDKQLSCLREISLSYKQSFFTIHFTKIDFYSAGKTEFAYTLEGLQENWISIGNARSISFTELPPGEYILKLRYSNQNGNWTTIHCSLPIHISPPWWKSWWFTLISLSIFLGLVFLVYKIRVQSIKKRNELLEKEVKIRTEQLSESNNELKESNEEIKLQKEQLQEYNEEVVRQSEKILSQQQFILEQNAQLEKTVEKLSLSDQTKNLFFTILAHDLKGPINAIGSLTDLLGNNIANLTKEEIVEFSNHIQKSASSTRELVYNLLDWARTQTNYLDYSPEDLNVSDLLLETLSLNEQQYVQKSIELVNHVNTHHCIEADKNMIETVLRNLVSNAIKYTPPKGTITLESFEYDSEIEIQLSDTGVGIEEEELKELFLLEKRISKKGTHGEHGTGLGLIIVKEFIETNKGTIQVSSQPNEGTTFSIRLPKSKIIVPPKVRYVQPAVAESSATTQLTEETLQEIHGNRILIVEDNAAMRNHLKHLLAPHFEITEAENGSQALMLVEETQPMVIITDLIMPVMDGLEFCKILKSNSSTSHVPVIVLTSQDTEENKLAGYYAGADIYLTKPVRKEVLYQVIFNILKSRTTLRQQLLAQPEETFETIPIPTLDQEFLQSITHFIETNLSDTNLEVHQLVRHMGLSRSVLYAKFKAITGQGVNEYIRLIRLRKSKELLLTTNKSINEIADYVGFTTASYYIRCFVKEYQCTPGEMRERKP